ncbi:MAG: hypothetical protein QW291_06055 [Thermofilaceae archaeon]
MGRGRSNKKPYPRNIDIVSALMRVLAKDPFIHPGDLVDRVKNDLEQQGFYAGLVTSKRVWRIYEACVRSGKIPDVLMVIVNSGNEGF